MCGITGLINCGDEAVLVKMTEILRHRGPDDEGMIWFPEFHSGLGHTRLSIIDLTHAGHQPMCNDDRTLWITYNGELYNFRDIRKELEQKGYKFKSECDTEVVLKSYEEWGEGCLLKFNGMFAFAIFDTKTNKLFAARDRIGVKPFYYFYDKDRFIFASEIKSILASEIVKAEPDYFALHTPTRYQISPYTGFKNIFKLPPAHLLIFKDGNLTIRRYWNINSEEDDISLEEAEKNLDFLINDSVKKQMLSDVPVGLFLSGGLDSSIIASQMRKNTSQKIHAFTIKFSESDNKYEKSVDDSIYAKQIAQKYDFNYYEFEIKPDICKLLEESVWFLDEPLSDPASINTYLISKTARDNGIIVLLNGMGGDEIFGGYRKHLACILADKYQKYTPELCRKLIEKFFTAMPVASSYSGFKKLRWLKRFFSFASLPQYERYLVSDLSLSLEQYHSYFIDNNYYSDTYFYQSQKNSFSQNGLSYLTKMCLNDTKVFLPEHNLTYSDKASMAAGVESRPPLTDHRIAEFMFTLKPEFRIKNRNQKYLLKKVASKYLPANIVKRPKAPFGSPLRAWIKGQLKEMIDDILSEESLKKRKLYNIQYIRQLINDDRKGKSDNAHIIWTLLTDELWFRKFGL